MFCELYMPEYLMNNENYKEGKFKKALEETFVKLDWLLVTEEGHEMMAKIVLDLKKAVRGPGAKLDINE